MQLLGVSWSVCTLVLLIFFSENLWADEPCEDGPIISHISLVVCNQKRLERVDRVLNEEYELTLDRVRDKNKLASTQSLWIRYRDKYCRSIYDHLDLGREAIIERISCLTQVAASRVNELVSLRAGSLIGGIYRAREAAELDEMGVGSNGVVNGLSERADEKLWRLYTTANCDMMVASSIEYPDAGIARMRSQF